MRNKVRRLRHWKQRFHPDAEFIFRRPVNFLGKRYEPNDPIPQALADHKTKLRRFWESGIIELALFEAPNVATGVVDEPKEEADDEVQLLIDTAPDGVEVERGNGSWFVVRVGEEEHKVNGKAALEEKLAELEAELSDALD